MSDDFERFCRIAQPTKRTSLSPTVSYGDDYDDARRYTASNLLGASQKMQRKRPSSFREPRQSHGQISANRSPIRYRPGGSHSPVQFAQNLSPEMVIPRERKSSHSPDGKHIYIQGNKPINRAGSMREYVRKPSGSNYAINRPSEPTIVIDRELTPMEQINDNVIKVRQFHRKKSGQIISKGDKAMLQSNIIIPHSTIPASAKNLRATAPMIYTDDVSDDSEMSLSDSEVIEIPAITRSLVTSPDDAPEPPQTVLTPTKLGSPVIPTRYRSRSWAVITAPEHLINEKQLSMSPSESFPNNQPWQVQVLGGEHVGKTSVCLQFQTSESLDVVRESGMHMLMTVFMHFYK